MALTKRLWFWRCAAPVLAAVVLASCTSLNAGTPDSGVGAGDGGLTGGSKGSGGLGGRPGGGGSGGAGGPGGSGATGGSATGGSLGTGGAPQSDAGMDAPAGKPAMLVVGPTSTYDFGPVEVGHASAAATFTVTNKGE